MSRALVVLKSALFLFCFLCTGMVYESLVVIVVNNILIHFTHFVINQRVSISICI